VKSFNKGGKPDAKRSKIKEKMLQPKRTKYRKVQKVK
jgi:hypothetical protein